MNNNAEKLQNLWEKLKEGKITTVGGVQPTYEQRVASLIRAKYTVNDEIALINNYNAYLADNSLTEYAQEYAAYQTFRQDCKEKAKGE